MAENMILEPEQFRATDWKGVIDLDKIDRFTEYIQDRLDPQGIVFLTEILKEIELLVKYASQKETDITQLSVEINQLRESIKFWILLIKWIDEGKFTSVENVKNFADVAISKTLHKRYGNS